MGLGGWIAKCSVNLLAGVVAFSSAASAATIPKNIAAMANLDDDELNRPFVMRAASSPASTAKGQRHRAEKLAKPRLLVAAAPNELRGNPAKHNHAKSGKEKLFPR